MELLTEIENPAVKQWYEQDKRDHLGRAYEWAKVNGYEFDKGSGLFLKTPQGIKPGFGIQIIAPRPVDLHFHRDVAESFHILNGSVEVFFYDEKCQEYHSNLDTGDAFKIPAHTPHTFRQELFTTSPLEVLVKFDKPFDPSQEVCITPFYNFSPWIEE